MQTQQTESAAATELRRLLKRIIVNVETKSIDQSEWWSTGLDTLTEKMRPLWSQIGIERPGLYVQQRKRRINDPKTEPPGHWFKDFITHDPDEDSERRLTLACGNGIEQWNTTANSLKSLLYVVQAWIDLLETKFLTTKETTAFRSETDLEVSPESISDWDLAKKVLTDKKKILAQALLESRFGMTHSEMAQTGAVEGKNGAPPTPEAAKVAKFGIMAEWESLKDQWTSERYRIDVTEETKSKKTKRFKAYAEKINV